MNFCLKGHLFIRKIESIAKLPSGRIIIYFEKNPPFLAEYIEVTPEEIETIPEIPGAQNFDRDLSFDSYVKKLLKSEY